MIIVRIIIEGLKQEVNYMGIGDVIREYRKRKNMTQEQMANYLGVTAPAVNKWENGNSLPDITLLAPIARLLDISLDTLLSFHETLSNEEINKIITELDFKLREETYDEAFHYAKLNIKKYPNCHQLIWQSALILDTHRLAKDILNTDNYEEYIHTCYVRALESENEDIRTSTADSLYGFHIRKEEYEKAEEYLKYFSNQNPLRKEKQDNWKIVK
ncbi:helix-turn-helix domain-containing protein [Staphylococcus capitis]|uniref:helix-turn-helix domain-containing protein n=3 Tax=Bacillati TaxID=1783272 RepID=UPI0037093CE2